MKRYALIVAAGSGTRMASSLAKQFMLLAGKPVLMHTIRRFYETDPDMRLVVVLPAQEITYWKGLCQQHSFTIPHELIPGGATRFQSVSNGLQQVPGGCLVAVHDGVRPFVNSKLIRHCFEEAALHGNAIPCIPVYESLRHITPESNERADRNEYMLVQTPQCFQSELLKKAYASSAPGEFTDDASVLEASGATIHLVQGLKENIKLTTPTDFHMAEGLIKFFENQEKQERKT